MKGPGRAIRPYSVVSGKIAVAARGQTTSEKLHMGSMLREAGLADGKRPDDAPNPLLYHMLPYFVKHFLKKKFLF
jgi:hypothetical protein